MDDIRSLAALLSEKIRASDAYKAYQAAREEVSKDENLTLKLYRFKKVNADYQFRLKFEKQDDQISMDEEKLIAAQYHDLCRNPHTRAYLENERKLLSMLSVISNTLQDGFDIEMIF